MKILIIIPAYNEAKSILKTIDDIKTNTNNCDYIVINDCSNDDTKELLESNLVNHLDLPVNMGLECAVQTGYRYACKMNYDAAIQFDGDGQHQAYYIMQLAEAIQEGANIAIGSRFITHSKDWSLRMIGSRIISGLIYLKTHLWIHDPTSGMRMLDKETLYDYAYKINRRPEPDTLTHEICEGRTVKEIQVEMNDRYAGTSTYSSIWNSIKYMIKMIISILFIS